MTAERPASRRLDLDAEADASGTSHRSRFYRSKSGQTIHRAECHLAHGSAVPWKWADDKTDHEVAWTILGKTWLRPCRRCMGGMADAL